MVSDEVAYYMLAQLAQPTISLENEVALTRPSAADLSTSQQQKMPVIFT